MWTIKHQICMCDNIEPNRSNANSRLIQTDWFEVTSKFDSNNSFRCNVYLNFSLWNIELTFVIENCLLFWVVERTADPFKTVTVNRQLRCKNDDVKRSTHSFKDVMCFLHCDKQNKLAVCLWMSSSIAIIALDGVCAIKFQMISLSMNMTHRTSDTL